MVELVVAASSAQAPAMPTVAPTTLPASPRLAMEPLGDGGAE
jgi:hypothetical protein